jgi:hypothetical protein
MLARIQSLYLFLAALLAAASMLFPFWSFSSESLFVISDFGASTIADIRYTIACYAGSAFSPLTAAISLAAVFLFNKRDIQTKLIIAAMAFFALDLFSGLAAAHFMNLHFLEIGTAMDHRPETGFYLLLPEPVLLFMAMKGIKKDEKIATAYKRL